MTNTSKQFRTFAAFRIKHVWRSTLLLTLGLLAARCVQAQTVSAAFVSGESTSSKTSEADPLPDAVTFGPASRKASISQSDDFAGQSSASASFPGFAQRGRHFVSDLLGPQAFIAPAFESAIDTARPLKVAYPSDGFVAPGKHPAHGSVPEWGEGAQGYAKRYADRFGQGLIGTTSRYALGEVLRQDVSYHRCQCTGLLPRTTHALAAAYLARTRGGRTVPSLPALASPYIASEVAVVAWYPERFHASDALRISVLNYVAAPLKNLFGEFVAK